MHSQSLRENTLFRVSRWPAHDVTRQGSTERASAGRLSVTRLTQRMWMGRIGTGRPTSGARKSVSISPELVVRRYFRNFLILSYILRPSWTALTIVAKLSSRSIIWAASFETSVPVIPMATPMSALFSAGASLTPSPVMATNWPLS